MRFVRLPQLRLRRATSVTDDVDAEIASHIERTLERLVQQGWEPTAAHAEALRRFGDVAMTRHAMVQSALSEFGRQRRRDQLESVVADLHYIVRQLRRTPGFAIAAIGTMALGIGANAAMFGVLDHLLLRPPAHVQSADRVGRVYLHDRENGRDHTITDVSYDRLKALRERAARLIDLAGMYQGRVIIGRGVDARPLAGALITPNLTSVLGARTHIGRFFDSADDGAPDGAAVAVLGYDYWRVAHAADSTVIGKGIAVGSREFTIVGVAPRGFTGPGLKRVDVWLPVTSARAIFSQLDERWQNDNSFWWLSLVGRLRDGVSREQAATVLGTAFSRHVEAKVGRPDSTARASVWPLLEERGPERSDATRVALWLGAVAALVLLLACANVANLLLARTLQRRGEIAVRLALGVSRARLVSSLLMESLVLVVLGAAAGLTLAAVAGSAFQGTLFPHLDVEVTVFDGRVLAFALTAATVVTLLSGLGPALYASQEDVRGMLTSSARITSHRSRLRASLLVGQAALSTVLLVAAGLFVRSLRSASATDLGFDGDRLLVVRVDARSSLPVSGGMGAAYERIAERLRSLPRVQGAATTLQIPFGLSGATEIHVPGIDSLQRFGSFTQNFVGDDYFETTGTRILLGRALSRDDQRGSGQVIVVSDSMASVLWPGQSALGKCVRVGDVNAPCAEVVGVAANIHQYDVRAEPSLQYWMPASASRGENSGPYGVLVRVEGDPALLVNTIRLSVQPLVPPNAYVAVRPIAESVSAVIRPWRLGAMMFGAFGGLGLLIAAVGLYSVLAYSVGQRRREIGVRTALGARRTSVLSMVLWQGVRLTAVGVSIGLVVAAATGGRLAPLLIGVGPRDPLVIGVVVATLLAAALLASVIPAWRAARVDPALVLRDG